MSKKALILNILGFVVAVIALPFLLILESFGCAPGYDDMGNGVCAADLQPEKMTQAQEVQPSSETPRRGQQREWETGEVKADMPVSTAGQDAKMDAERVEADGAGKKAAGL